MSRRTIIAIALSAAVLVQAVRPAPARATDWGQVALYAGIGAVALGGMIWLGTRLMYPEQVHMLAPEQPNPALTQPPTSRLRFGAQCRLSTTEESPDGPPILCW